jgi:hypothetical protein
MRMLVLVLALAVGVLTVGWGTAAFAQLAADKCWFGQLQAYLSCLPPSTPLGYGH